MIIIIIIIIIIITIIITIIVIIISHYYISIISMKIFILKVTKLYSKCCIVIITNLIDIVLSSNTQHHCDTYH